MVGIELPFMHESSLVRLNTNTKVNHRIYVFVARDEAHDFGNGVASFSTCAIDRIALAPARWKFLVDGRFEIVG